MFPYFKPNLHIGIYQSNFIHVSMPFMDASKKSLSALSFPKQRFLRLVSIWSYCRSKVILDDVLIAWTCLFFCGLYSNKTPMLRRSLRLPKRTWAQGCN